MKGRINGSGDAILPEGRKRIVGDHLVFVGFAPVQTLQLLQAVQIKESKTRLRDGSKIAATSLNRQNTDGSPVNGSRNSNFELVFPPPKLVMRRSAPNKIGAIAQQRQADCFRAPGALRRSHRSLRRDVFYFRHKPSPVVFESFGMLDPICRFRAAQNLGRERAIHHRAYFGREAAAPVARICMAMLPSAVASAGPARTVGLLRQQ